MKIPVGGTIGFAALRAHKLLLGRHVSPVTTVVYTHPSDEEMGRRVRTLAC